MKGSRRRHLGRAEQVHGLITVTLRIESWQKELQVPTSCRERLSRAEGAGLCMPLLARQCLLYQIRHGLIAPICFVSFPFRSRKDNDLVKPYRCSLHDRACGLY